MFGRFGGPLGRLFTMKDEARLRVLNSGLGAWKHVHGALPNRRLRVAVAGGCGLWCCGVPCREGGPVVAWWMERAAVARIIYAQATASPHIVELYPSDRPFVAQHPSTFVATLLCRRNRQTDFGVKGGHLLLGVRHAVGMRLLGSDAHCNHQGWGARA